MGNLEEVDKFLETYTLSKLKQEEISQIHNLTLHLKELEKEQQIKPKTSRRQEIIKIKAEINAIETQKDSRTGH